jgi:hypothetical protein
MGFDSDNAAKTALQLERTTQRILLSILQTCRQQNRPAFRLLQHLLCLADPQVALNRKDALNKYGSCSTDLPNELNTRHFSMR